MRIYLLSLLLLHWTCPLIAQTPVFSLSSPVVAGGTNSTGSVRPRVAASAGNIPVVLWSKSGTPSRIYTSRWNGTAFTLPLQMNPAGVDIYAGPSEGPNIAASGDTVFVAFFSIPTSSSKIYVVRSLDAGITFGDTVRADHQTSKPPYSPFIALDQNGNPYLTYEASFTNMTAPEQLFCRSTDGGMSFMNEVNANMMAPGEPCECCPPSIVLKDSLVFLMYRNNINNFRNIYVAVSTDFGATFPNVVQIDNTNWFINGCPSTGPEGVIAGDSLLVTWRSTVSGKTRIHYNKMHIGSLQAGAVRKADPAFTGSAFQDHPSVAGANDTIAIVWDDNRTGNHNCYMVASVDGGSTFSEPVMINDTAAQAGVQRNPHVAYKNGVFHIVYQNSAANEVIYRTAQITGMLGIPTKEHIKPVVSAAPNPFTNSTTLRFSNNEGKPVQVVISDITGRIIKTFPGVNGSSVIVEAGLLTPGIYTATVTWGNSIASARLVMIE
jgi:hypothetical protein